MLSRLFPCVGSLSRAVLPQDCQLCGTSRDGALICAACSAALPRIASPCPVCAMPTPGGAVCGQCLRRRPRFDATCAALDYAFPVDRLVQALKYGSRLPLAAFLGDLLAAAVAGRNEAPPVDLLLPMPLHPARLRERGFNQAVEIARRVAARSGIAPRLDGAERIKDTPPQAGLKPEQRRASIRRAFACTARLDGLTVAVIDDVMTTGATLDELAKTLKRAGAARVENWVAARTVAHPPSGR